MVESESEATRRSCRPYLHVSVKDVGRVHVLDSLEELVNNVLLVNVLENVGADDGVEVRLLSTTSAREPKGETGETQPERQTDRERERERRASHAPMYSNTR